MQSAEGGGVRSSDGECLGAQSPTTYKMLNAVSKKEDYYADPLYRFLWLVLSTIGLPCRPSASQRAALLALVYLLHVANGVVVRVPGTHGDKAGACPRQNASAADRLTRVGALEGSGIEADAAVVWMLMLRC